MAAGAAVKLAYHQAYRHDVHAGVEFLLPCPLPALPVIVPCIIYADDAFLFGKTKKGSDCVGPLILACGVHTPAINEGCTGSIGILWRSVKFPP
eukprot:COSAG01_NODE_20260_length_963_cov_1.010417_1_plen_93_part_10